MNIMSNTTFSFDKKNLRNKAELIIGLSNWCNYDCSYCMPHSKSRTSKLDNTTAIIKIIHDSFEHFKKYAEVDNYGVLFVGGEPTIHPEFNKIIDSIQDIRIIEPNYKIIIVTNLSRTERWLKDISSKVTGIVASYHDEFALIDEFTGKIETCMRNNPDLHITIGIQPLPGRLEKLENDCYIMRNKLVAALGKAHTDAKLDFIIQHLYKGMDELYPYSDHDFRMFKQLIAEFSNPHIDMSDRLSEQEDFLVHSFTDKKDEFLGSKCYAGIEGLTVGFNGTLQRTSRCALNNEQKYLGNIYTEYTLPKDPAVCDVPTGCGNCWFDYSFRKIK
jgi:MoaA/NifB/PqqE/SkfB family radical SAM enzyme